MNFKNTMEKIAQGLGAGLQLMGVFSPVVQSFAPQSAAVITRVEDAITQVGRVVISAQSFATVLSDKGITGADRARASGPAVAQILLQTELFAGKKVDAANQAAFLQKSGELAGIISDLINLLHPDNVKVQS